MLRYEKASDRMIAMSHAQVLEIEAIARKLSDDYSLLIALSKMNEAFVTPYGPGEIQGNEVITPYDPAPPIDLAEQV